MCAVVGANFRRMGEQKDFIKLGHIGNTKTFFLLSALDSLEFEFFSMEEHHGALIRSYLSKTMTCVSWLFLSSWTIMILVFVGFLIN